MNKSLFLPGMAGLSLLLAVLVFSGVAHAVEDSQIWAAADKKLWHSGKSTLYFYAEVRTAGDDREVDQYYLGPRYNYRISEHWAAGGAVKSINIKRNGEFEDLYRFELELTYLGKAGAGKIDLRNRVESIHEDARKDVTRYRHRLRYKRPVSGSGAIKAFFMSDEIFYAENAGSYHLLQNRFIPFGFDVSVGSNAVVSLYYQYLHKNNIGREDDKIHVLGATLNF